MRALFMLCLLAASAHAELPTIDTEFPPTLRVESAGWNVTIERVGVEIRSAPEVTFVTIAVTGRERTVELLIDVPQETKLVGLGVDGPEGRAWGRPMPVQHARDRQTSSGGAVLRWTSTSVDQDHLKISVNVPSTIELALHLPPLARLAIETSSGRLAVEVAGEKLPTKHKRVVVELEDIAGTRGEIEMPYVTETVALVAAPASVTDFLPADAPPRMNPPGTRDIDKAMIRRRMKWIQPGLRGCFLHAAQWSGLRAGLTIVSFMILADGTVEWAKANQSDLPASVNACLVEHVMRLEFPQADGNVLVNYPLSFRAND